LSETQVALVTGQSGCNKGAALIRLDRTYLLQDHW
jgi:hypothetical protein